MKTGRTTWEKMEIAGIAQRKGVGKIEDMIMSKINSRFGPVPAGVTECKYPVGSFAMYGDSKVKIIGFERGQYELEYAETGDWAANEVPSYELSPVKP